MPKFLISIGGKPNIYGFKRQEFKWSEAHKKFLFLGREIDEGEFNEQVEKALSRYHDLNPRVTMLASVSQDLDLAEPTPPAPVATIAPAQEITAEMALEVLQRLAPDLLKKKSGRPPKAAAVA